MLPIPLPVISFDPISQIIHSDQASLVDLLVENATFKFAKDRHPDLTSYLTKCLSDVLDLCFSHPDEPCGTRAFMLFTRPNVALLEALFKDDILFTRISEVLFDPSPDVRLVSRAATLLRQLIVHFPEQSLDCCGFLVKILEFVYEPGVLDLIEKVCEEKAPLALFHRALCDAQWAETVASMLEIAESEFLIAGLMRTVRIASTNPILAPSFQSSRMLRMLLAFVDHSSRNVQNELWWAVFNATVEQNLAQANLFVAPAVQKFRTRIDRIDRAGIFALDFLAAMVVQRAMSVADAITRQMQEIILGLTASFPDSSNLMGSVFRFIRACLLWPVTMAGAIEMFVPAMAAEATDGMRTAASAHCIALLDELSRSRKTMPELDRALKPVEMFGEFCRTNLPNYRKISRDPYGGPVVPANSWAGHGIF
jgi:hypothetical protein